MAVAAPNPVYRVGPELQESARRVLESQTFSRCSRLRAFLDYVVTCAAENRLHEVNEYSLGVAVFGRPQDFSPSEDNIVRVTARQLRVKIEEYYHGEGAADLWRIEIPKGGYVPHLLPNLLPEPEIEADLSAPDGSPASATGQHRKRMLAPAALFVGALACAGWALAAWLLVQGSPWPAAPLPSAYVIDALFADPSLSTTVIMDDPLLPIVRRATGATPNLNQFLSGTYLDSSAYSSHNRTTLFPLIVNGDLIRPDTVTLFGRLSEVAMSRGGRIQATQARKFSPKQLGQGNLLLLGGIGSNPWLSAFQDHLAFKHQIDDQAGQRKFVNRFPKLGEPAAFITDEHNPTSPRFYTRVAVLPNPHGAGNVVLLGGTSLHSTTGAYRFALSQQGVDEIESHCGKSLSALAQFEVILETHAVGNTPTRWTVQAVRCEAPPTD